MSKAAKNLKQQYTTKQTEDGYYIIDPMPSDAELHDYYANKYYTDDSSSQSYQAQYSDDEMQQKNLKADQYLYAIEKAIGSVKDKKLFEVGFGEGFLLNKADQAGMEIDGVDFTSTGLRAMNPHLEEKLNFGDAYAYIDSLIEKGEAQFDVCVLQNVLEHITDPAGLLANLKKLLKPGGVIVGNVPNDYSRLQLKAMETGLIDKEFWFAPIDHLYYFNTENFKTIFEKSGLRVVDMFGDFPIDMFLFNENANYVKDGSKGRGAHQARLTLDLLLSENGLPAYHQFCQALSGVGMGRNVCIIAQK